MCTVTIQIGNSDDKLTQAQWAKFVSAVNDVITSYTDEVHFFGASSSCMPWQNAAWVITCHDNVDIDRLKNALSIARNLFHQDSVAWTEGETIFV